MRAGDRIVIDGAPATVIKVRKTVPVAVVEYDDGYRWLHWYGDEPSAPPAEVTVQPCTPRWDEEVTDTHAPLEADSGDGSVTCRDCSKTWTGFKPEHCMSCHETFGGTWAGDRHRVGKFNDPDDPRRCLDPIEAGLELGTRGHWSRPHVWDHEAV